jgi:hypothetical protein
MPHSVARYRKLIEQIKFHSPQILWQVDLGSRERLLFVQREFMKRFTFFSNLQKDTILDKLAVLHRASVRREAKLRRRNEDKDRQIEIAIESLDKEQMTVFREKEQVVSQKVNEQKKADSCGDLNLKDKINDEISKLKEVETAKTKLLAKINSAKGKLLKKRADMAKKAKQDVRSIQQKDNIMDRKLKKLPLSVCLDAVNLQGFFGWDVNRLFDGGSKGKKGSNSSSPGSSSGKKSNSPGSSGSPSRPSKEDFWKAARGNSGSPTKGGPSVDKMREKLLDSGGYLLWSFHELVMDTVFFRMQRGGLQLNLEGGKPKALTERECFYVGREVLKGEGGNTIGK